MNPKVKVTKDLKTVGTAAVLCAVVLAALLANSPRAQAQDAEEESFIRRGFAIAPVPLNLAGKNLNLVGLGSYLVNARSDCNSCHNAGEPPSFDFAVGFNPYLGQPKKLDPAVYLGGGQDFGPAGEDPKHPGPDIVSRNLTPDKTGRPVGGHTLGEFKQILKTGVDFDHLHPTCSALPITNCIPAPVNGGLLQIMPWPTFQNMTDRDLDAIYEYLSAIPCIEGPPAPSPLHNECH